MIPEIWKTPKKHCLKITIVHEIKMIVSQHETGMSLYTYSRFTTKIYCQNMSLLPWPAVRDWVDWLELLIQLRQKRKLAFITQIKSRLIVVILTPTNVHGYKVVYSECRIDVPNFIFQNFLKHVCIHIWSIKWHYMRCNLKLMCDTLYRPRPFVLSIGYIRWKNHRFEL